MICSGCACWPLLFNGCATLLGIGGTGTRCRVRRSRASQTLSVGDMSVDTHVSQCAGCCVEILAASHPCHPRRSTAMKWRSSGPSIGIHNTINKMCPHSLSISRACSHRNYTSPKCQDLSIVSICPLKSVTTANHSGVETQIGLASLRALAWFMFFFLKKML